MKKLELDASTENLLQTMKINAIDRDEELVDFLEFIDGIEGTTNIAIDGNWGTGKTFFVRQAIILFDYYRNESNNNSEKAEEQAEVIKAIECFKKINLSKSYRAVYYDSWLWDDHNDPLLSLIYTIVNHSGFLEDDSVKNTNIKKKLCELSKTVASIFGVHLDIEKIFDRQSSHIEQIDSMENIKQLIKGIFDEIINEHSCKLVVFVDELDRCKPDYAVGVLEKSNIFLMMTESYLCFQPIMHS